MSQKHIFVVDDSEMFAQMVRDHLEQKPSYKVSVFSTGEEALKHLYESPDVVILDFHLNDVYKEAANGLAILEQIKAEQPRAQVIMLSSQEKYSVAAKTISKGAVQYVAKDDSAFDKISNILDDVL